jgi:hypothetical protein
VIISAPAYIKIVEKDRVWFIYLGSSLQSDQVFRVSSPDLNLEGFEASVAAVFGNLWSTKYKLLFFGNDVEAK